MRYASKDIFGSTEKFVELFNTKYGVEPDFTASGAAVGVVLQLAIERARSKDRNAVRAELKKGGFEPFFAPIFFGPSGMANSYVSPVYQIQVGKVEVVFPEEVATAKLKPRVGG